MYKQYVLHNVFIQFNESKCIITIFYSHVLNCAVYLSQRVVLVGFVRLISAQHMSYERNLYAVY